MLKNNSHKGIFLLLLGILLIVFLIDISLGSVVIPLKNTLNIIFGNATEKSSWQYIILDFRLPKAITAMIAGIGLSVSGLIMQTFFRNPLAGPYVLGVSSGASLGVALVILGSGFTSLFLTYFLQSSYLIVLASSLGSFLVLLGILSFAKKLKNSTSLLIIGLMFSSFTSAIVGILSYFSTAEELQKFTLWAMGNLGGLSWENILILILCCIIGLAISLLSIKSLNTLLLGENYAISLGLNLKKTRYYIILATSILAGSITAFIGPIAFVGIAVPHISKLIFKTSHHHVLFWGTILIGAILLLICDCLSQLPGNDLILPINAITSIFGAPVVIWLLVRKKTTSND